MHKHLPSILATAAFVAAVLIAPARAQIVSGNDYVRIEVRVQTGQDRAGGKGKADTVTQEKTLNLTLSGKARPSETRKGKWQAYARDMKDNTLTPIDSGDFDIDFSKGPQKVESAKVSTTYTPEHSVNSGKGGRGGSGGRGGNTSKKVAAEGKKFAGFAVIVKDGEKVVGEYYDPQGLKGQIAK